MGLYVQTPVNTGKAGWLMINADAKDIRNPTWDDVVRLYDEGRMVICVVMNGPFDAVGVPYCEEEFNVFDAERRRPIRWMHMPLDKAMQLSGLAWHEYMKHFNQKGN